MRIISIFPISFYVFFEIFIQCMLPYIFSFSNSSEILYPPTSCSFSLLNTIPKTNTKEKSHWRHMESKLCWVTLSERRASLDVWLMYSVSLHRRKLIFPLPLAVFVINFLARTGDLCPVPLFCTGVLSRWTLYKLSHDATVSWVHMYICPVKARKLCLLEIVHHLLQSLHPLFCIELFTLRRELW